MRTKTMLIAAAVMAAGALTSMAQVYSANIVGYINVSVPKGFSLIANQLNNTPDNTILTLLPAATTPDLTTVYKFDTNSGSFASERIEGGTWTSGGATTLNPGEGAFLFAPSAFTATFVGEVQLNSSWTILPGFSIVSSVIPQAGNLYDPTLSGPDLLYGVPALGETIYQFVNPPGSYSSFQWTGDWGATPTGPALAVGEAFFHFGTAAGGAHTWTRNFVVGPP